MNLKMLQ